MDTEDRRTSTTEPVVWIALAAVVLVAIALLCWDIDEPFVGQHDSCTAEFSHWARHWLRNGLVRTRMGQIIDSGPLELIERPRYYLHCTPLLTGEIALSFLLFGVHEWSARLVPIAHSIVLVVLTFLCGRTLWGKREGLAAAAFLTVMPMFAYYGRVAEYLTAACPLYLLVLLLYRRWLDVPSRARLVPLAGAGFLAALYSHEGYVFVGLVLVHGAFVTRRAGLSLLAVFAVACLALALQLLHIAVLIGAWDTLADMQDVWTRRGPGTAREIGFFELWTRQAIYFLLYLGPVPMLLCIAGVVGRIMSRPKHVRKGGWLLVLYAVHGLIMLNLWRGLAYNHEYFLYSLTPAIALACARALVLSQSAAVVRRVPVLRWLIAASALGGHAWYGFGYTRSLHRLDYFTPSREFGVMIETRVPPNVGVMTNLHPDQYHPTFLFYVDRHLRYGVGSDPHVQRLLADRRRNYGLLALWHEDGRKELVGFPDGLRSFEKWTRERGNAQKRQRRR